MKRLFLIGASAVCAAATASAQDSLSPYLSFGAGASLGRFDAGGYNSAGGFANTGEADDRAAFGSVAIGLRDLAPLGAHAGLRAELELTRFGAHEIETPSFPGPPRAYSYASTVDTTALMVNLWADFPVAETRNTVSFGLGLGGARSSLETEDGRVTGEDTDTDFAYSVGAQLAHRLEGGAEIGASVRYADFGTVEAALSSGAGSLSHDRAGVQLGVFLRIPLGPSN